MEQVAVEKDRGTWVQLAVDQFQPFDGHMNALRIGSGLIADFDVIHASNVVGATKDLQAAVLLRRSIDGNHAARQIRQQAAVVVPVSVILVPGPGAPDARFFENHLVVEVIDLIAQEAFHCLHNAARADNRTIDVAFAKFIFYVDFHRAAFAVSPAGRSGDEGPIGPRDVPQQIRLIAIEQPFDDEESIIVEACDLF
jgi:hypothetical protein